MIEQHVASSVDGQIQFIPPLAEEFRVPGGEDTIERARRWALWGRYWLYRGPAAHCAHGLYRMHMCPNQQCNSAKLDHTNLWIQDEEKRPFILTHPYAQEIPEATKGYARAHGLDVSVATFEPENPFSDAWYGSATLGVRLSVPQGWPLWPIERDAIVAIATMPTDWPEDVA